MSSLEYYLHYHVEDEVTNTNMNEPEIMKQWDTRTDQSKYLLNVGNYSNVIQSVLTFLTGNSYFYQNIFCLFQDTLNLTETIPAVPDMMIVCWVSLSVHITFIKNKYMQQGGWVNMGSSIQLLLD